MPAAPRWHPGWSVFSVLVHLAAIGLLVVFSGPTFTGPNVEYILIAPPEGSGGSRETEMLGYVLGEAGGTEGRGGRGGAQDESDAPRIPFDVENVRPIGVEVVRRTGAGGDALGGEGPIGTDRVLGPAYGDGRLWVRAKEAELGIVGPSATADMHVARVDSAVRAKMQEFLNTMPRDSFAPAPPPDWTIDSESGTWGMDAQWIYLGDIKLPTMLLALLPLPQGNYEQAQRAAELSYMRQDILQAARRAETAADFKRYIEEIRKRKDAERALEKGEKRDTITP